ncbi:hypothetical protein H5410_007810, partial [Solanum commersonii]
MNRRDDYIGEIRVDFGGNRGREEDDTTIGPHNSGLSRYWTALLRVDFLGCWTRFTAGLGLFRFRASRFASLMGFSHWFRSQLRKKMSIAYCCTLY